MDLAGGKNFENSIYRMDVVVLDRRDFCDLVVSMEQAELLFCLRTHHYFTLFVL
jgi:hypothetical protein